MSLSPSSDHCLSQDTDGGLFALDDRYRARLATIPQVDSEILIETQRLTKHHSAMNASPKSNSWLSPGTSDEGGPFRLERYLERRRKLTASYPKLLNDPPPSFPDLSRIFPRPHHPSNPTFNNKPLQVDGPGLLALVNITYKADAARDKTLAEIDSSSSSKLRKCLLPAESRDFVNKLYNVELAIATTAALVDQDEELFYNIDPVRIELAWKLVCKSIRDLALALGRMSQECGSEKHVRICRKYVVRVLRRIVFHFAKLVFGMEREVQRVWIGTVRYGDDMNTGSLLKSRLTDWLSLAPRLLDKLFCKSPDYVTPLGRKEDVFIQQRVGKPATRWAMC